MNHLGKNLIIVLALVAAGFFAAWLRFRPYLGNEGRYTDGVRNYDVASGGEVRYAVWDAARRLAGEANGPEADRSPTLSPDGRYMVFCIGEPGLGRDLYLAEMLDGQAIDPRPLSLLNTEADECAPCFSGGALYFASDRLGTAGGLDLYRARYDHGLFEVAERLTGEINSTSDDTDPAPAPGTDTILFASDRSGGALPNFDLFLARPVVSTSPEDERDGSSAESAEWRVESLAVLNSGYDERDPAFTADGRTVFFSSDRALSLGGFDLYRSSLGNDGWIPPVPLEGINSQHSERGPMPTRDGFELLFSVETTNEPADLFRARSRELFRTPGRPVGWRELLFLAVLLALALLAWLAKRWEQLEILYKCILVSLLVHLLAMWAFQDVFPEGGEYELRGDSNRILVRLISNPTGPLASNAERGGDLQVEQEERVEDAQRAEAERAVATAAEADLARLDRAAQEQVAAPERSGPSQQVRTTTAAPTVDVQHAAEQFKRMAGAQRELALEAARAEDRPEQAESDAERDRRTADVVAEARPEVREQSRAEEGAELPAAPVGDEASEAPSTREERSSVAVAQPAETHERIAGAAPELSVQAAATGAAAPTSNESAERSESEVDALAERAAVAPATELARADRGKTAPPTPSERAASTEAREHREVRELATEVALADAADAAPRISGGAPTFAVQAQSTGGQAQRPVQSAARSAARSETVAASEPAPRSQRQTRATQGADLPRAPGAGAASERPTRLDAQPGVEVAQPSEARERIAGAAPKLSVEASEAGQLGPRDDVPVAERGDAAAPDALAQGELAAPAAGDLPRADQGREAPLEALAGRGATSELPTRSADTSRPSVALSDVEREAFERIEGAARSLTVEAGATGAGPPRTAEEAQRESGGAEVAMTSGATPAQVEADRGIGTGLPEAPGASASSELPTLRETTGRMAVAQPVESVTRLAGVATELTLEAGTTSDGVLPADVGEAERNASGSRSSVVTDAARPAETSASLTRDRNESEELGEPTARGTVEGPGVLDTRTAQLDLRDAQDSSESGLGAEGRSVKPAELVFEATTFGEHSAGERRLVAERSVLETREGRSDVLGPAAAATLSRPRREQAFAGPPGRGLGSEVASSQRGSPRVALRDQRSGTDGPLIQGPESAPDSGITRALADTLLALAPTGLDRNRDASTAGPRRLESERAASRAEAVPSFRPLEALARRTQDDEGPERMTRWPETPYQSRAGIQKQLALQEHGGSEETEAAVARGLAYLASKQKRNGYWGSADDRHDKYEHVAVGKTGLALLAFLGAAHTQDSNSEYSQVVERAVQFLIAVQDEETGHFGLTSSYSHGIAAYALGECFALTGDERLRPTIERAVAQILRHQQRSADSRIHGGWSYYYSDDHIFDRWPRASITAWQVMALESARLGGVQVPDRAFEDARAFLRNCWDRTRGAFRYSHDPARLGSSFDVLPGSTPASLFALSLLGDDVAASKFGRARAFVLDRMPRGYRYTTDNAFVHQAQGNLYFWYYGTLALFRVDGEPWEMWNEGMKDALLPAQAEDGSWRPISIYATDYAGDTNRDRSYSTAMCVLTLEVYYRYFTPLLKVE